MTWGTYDVTVVIQTEADNDEQAKLTVESGLRNEFGSGFHVESVETAR